MAKKATPETKKLFPKPKTDLPIPTPPAVAKWRTEAQEDARRGRPVEIPARVQITRDVPFGGLKKGQEITVAPDEYRFDAEDYLVSHARGVRVPDDGCEVVGWRMVDQVPDLVEDGDDASECWMAGYDGESEVRDVTIWYDGLTSASIGNGYEVVRWRDPDWREIALERVLPTHVVEKFGRAYGPPRLQCLGDLAAEWKGNRKGVANTWKLTPDDCEVVEVVLEAAKTAELTWDNRQTWRAEENGGTKPANPQPAKNGKAKKAASKPADDAPDAAGEHAERLLAIETEISRLAVQEAKVHAYLKQLRRDMGEQNRRYQKLAKAGPEILPLLDGVPY